MNEETYLALQRISYCLTNHYYIFDKKDVKQLADWLDEVAKEYDDAADLHELNQAILGKEIK